MTEKAILTAVIFYILIINLISSLLTVIDKRKAVRNKWRITEGALLLAGFQGGAFGEYVTMKKIRHKTRHKKFMIGLPLILFLHVILIIFIIIKVTA